MPRINGSLISLTKTPIKKDNNDGQVELNLASNLSVAGGVGFEPTTPNLGGWCSVRDSYENTHDHYFITGANPY